MIKVSIIVPCYNVERFLERCMASLLHQTLKEIEIIIIDDESPDRVPQMCEEYAKNDTRVHIIHKKNEGLGMARNSGLEIAKGDYIAFCDSDDYVELNMYETLYEEAIASNADVVYSNFLLEDDNGKWHTNLEVQQRTEWIGEDIEHFMLDMVASAPYVKHERKYQMSVWHSIYKRNIIEDYHIRFQSERVVLSEDFPFQLKFLKHSKKVVYIPQAFYHYCSNGSSLTHQFNIDKFDRINNLYNVMFAELQDIKGSQERLDRFYIGYIRARINELLHSICSSKKRILQQVLSEPTLRVICARYPCYWLPPYQCIFYWLMKKKKIYGLFIFHYFTSVMKKWL